MGKCVTADVLVRKSERLYLNFLVNLTVMDGFDWNDTKSLVTSDFRGYIANNFELGPKLEFSDMTYDARLKVPGIDNIQIVGVEAINESGVIVGTHTRDVQFDSVTAVSVGTIQYGKAISYDAQT